MTLAYYISKGMSIEDGFDLLKSKRSIVNSKIKEYPAILELEKNMAILKRSDAICFVWREINKNCVKGN